MPLHKIREFYPDYRDQFGDHDVLGYSFYSGTDKIGSVDDLLVDDEGRFRYLVINTGAWIFGKKVLLPIGRARIDYNDKRIYADGLTREQVENLPEYDPNSALDYDYEERVRGVYRPMGTTTGTTGMMASPTSLDATPGMTDDTTLPLGDRPVADRTVNRDVNRDVNLGRDYDRSSYRYDYDPDLYNLNERDHQTLRLYEERLIADKTRRKTGEVAIGKHVETETQHVSVPVEKERVVIERVNPTDTDVASTVGTGAFQEGEVVRMEVYEETPDIRKEAFVREEVRVRKEVDRDTVETDETIRKERLDIDKDGNPLTRE
ncbi:DUF2382 domain-containing protein [Leptolyngbya sp. NK1-12]|uniref:DUF2382 domain-containing protein n=2 Tax=Leptolyngbya sp. NK1-12 TaxID=2547451 RepID=A0AA96WKK6_9CYAN|nr:DUF2382 domain-containing protein [Leptolyngbya sp. NK1-12]